MSYFDVPSDDLSELEKQMTAVQTYGMVWVHPDFVQAQYGSRARTQS